jgi:hypothetical protein
MTPKFGDFLALADDHLGRATGFGGDIPDTAMHDVVGEVRRVLIWLGRFAKMVTIMSTADPGSNIMDAPSQAATAARLALRQAVASMPTTADSDTEPDTSIFHPVANHLHTTANALAAGHSLLQAHFLPDAHGSSIGKSPWAPLIVSAPVRSALLTQVAVQARQLSPWMGKLAVRGHPTSRFTPSAMLAIVATGQWLHLADAAVRKALGEPDTVDSDRQKLVAIPVNTTPARQVLSGGEPLERLCAGISTSAVRLRRFASNVTGSRSLTSSSSTSWRRTAQAAAIIGNSCEPALRVIAQNATELGLTQAVAAQLRAGADATHDAWQAWRTAARGWDKVTTGPTTAISPVATEMGDLLLRIGRLTRGDPQWTPARDNATNARLLTDLAGLPAGVPAMLGAIHDATDAVARVGVCDKDAVQAAAASSRLYVPTRLMSGRQDIPRAFAPAPKVIVNELLISYGVATDISARAAVILDEVAVALDIPTRILAAMRTAERIGMPHLTYEREGAVSPVAGATPAAGEAEQTLLSLEISEPALIERAIAFDNAARLAASDFPDTQITAVSRWNHSANARPTRRPSASLKRAAGSARARGYQG